MPWLHAATHPALTRPFTPVLPRILQVFRFFLVSTAYTSVWLAVSSQLGSYREQFGPQVLLQLNIAYFLPSIPLLLVSGFFDKALETKLGGWGARGVPGCCASCAACTASAATGSGTQPAVAECA